MNRNKALKWEKEKKTKIKKKESKLSLREELLNFVGDKHVKRKSIKAQTAKRRDDDEDEEQQQRREKPLPHSTLQQPPQQLQSRPNVPRSISGHEDFDDEVGNERPKTQDDGW